MRCGAIGEALQLDVLRLQSVTDIYTIVLPLLFESYRLASLC